MDKLGGVGVGVVCFVVKWDLGLSLRVVINKGLFIMDVNFCNKTTGSEKSYTILYPLKSRGFAKIL